MLSFFLPLHFPCIIIAVFLHVTRSFPPSSAPEPLRTTFPFSCSESSHYPQTASLTASLRSGVLQRPLHPCFVSRSAPHRLLTLFSQKLLSFCCSKFPAHQSFSTYISLQHIFDLPLPLSITALCLLCRGARLISRQSASYYVPPPFLFVSVLRI